MEVRGDQLASDTLVTEYQSWGMCDLCYLITDFKHKQWICLTKLPDLDCHLRGHGDEDVRDEVVPGDGPDRGHVGGITPERGGAVVKSAEMQEPTLRANKVGVLSIRGQCKCVA